MNTNKPPQIQRPYTPPQPTLAHCSGCDALVITQIASWHEEDYANAQTGKVKMVKVPAYVRQEPPVNPVTGSVHHCEEALAWQLRVHGLRWNTVTIVPEQTGRGTVDEK